MTKNRNFKGISKRSRELLSSGENINVDYKQKTKGLHAEDLVAFANSNTGGTILIGVKEVTGPNGEQKGEPIGTPIGDDTKLQIMSKALSCSPPIQVEIFLENMGKVPFIRIEIPSGAHKPYATDSGTYKIREDARNNPILPEQLLKIFLEREAEEFSARFSEATGVLEERMSEALELVENLEGAISSKIEEIGSSLGWAEYKAGDAADTIEAVQSQVHSLMREAEKQGLRIKAITGKIEAEDPVKNKAENEVLEYLKKELIEKPKLLEAIENGDSLSISLSGDAAKELDKNDLKRLLHRAAEELLSSEKDA